jgi:hypothetical protein
MAGKRFIVLTVDEIEERKLQALIDGITDAVLPYATAELLPDSFGHPSMGSSEVKRLADFILERFPGEGGEMWLVCPNKELILEKKPESAVDIAIRLLSTLPRGG